MVTDTIMPPVHPGEILLTEFLEPLGVSQYQLAKAVDVPARRINEIVHGQRRVSAGTALRLARYFGTSEVRRLHAMSSQPFGDRRLPRTSRHRRLSSSGEVRPRWCRQWVSRHSISGQIAPRNVLQQSEPVVMPMETWAMSPR